MSTKKYASLIYKQVISDITDYKVDSIPSPTFTRLVRNNIMNSATNTLTLNEVNLH